MNVPRLVLILAVLLIASTGCRPDSVNRSPTPDASPDRFARAQQDEQRMQVEVQEAESRFFRGLRVNLADKD